MPSSIRADSHCTICKTTFKTRGALKHITACLNRQPDPNDDAPPHLLISAHGNHPSQSNAYALFALFHHRARLLHLDLILRAAWLECCAHLSEFEKDQQYFQCPEWPNPEYHCMHQDITRVIPPGEEAIYRYDMGSTTKLRIRVQQAPPQANTWMTTAQPEAYAAIIMQNLMPELCSTCREPATVVDDHGYSCDRCTSDPEPRILVNSPRDGVDCFDDSEGPNLTLLDTLVCAREANEHQHADETPWQDD